jgi:uncharacterized protein (TIGR02421 family)
MNTADKELRRLLKLLSLGPVVRPLNLIEQRDAFLSPRNARVGNSPVFKYEDFASKWTEVEPVLSLESSDAPQAVIELYLEKLRELENTRQMYAAVGSDSFTQFSIDIFGAPTAEDAHQAREVLEKFSDVDPPQRDCSAKDFAGLLKRRLGELDICMDVKLVSPMATRIWVDSVSKAIHLNQDTLFSRPEIQRLLVHEIDVHAVRIHNGACLPWGIFSMGTAGYRETEEGLAVYYERQSGHLYPFQEKIYAGRCLAVFLSLSAGFSEVFEELRAYLDEQTAYAIVARVKRGLSDTSRPGALTKEYHYFTGPKRVRSYLRRGSKLEMIMGGKIAFKHAPVVANLVQDGIIDTSKWIFPMGNNDEKGIGSS